MSIQSKLADLANLLFELKSRAMAEGSYTVEQAADCALDAWSDAFNHVTHMRRKNILQVTQSDYARCPHSEIMSMLKGELNDYSNC